MMNIGCIILVIYFLNNSILYVNGSSDNNNNNFEAFKLPKFDLVISLNNEEHTITIYVNDDPNMVVSAFCYDHSVNKNDCNSIRKVLSEKKSELVEQMNQHNSNGNNNITEGESILEGMRQMPITLDDTRLVHLDLFGQRKNNFYLLVQDFCEKHAISLMQCDLLLDMAFRKRLEAEGQLLYQTTVSSISSHENFKLVQNNIDRIKQFENKVQGVFHVFMTMYDTLYDAYKSKIEPSALLLVENNRMHGEVFRYLLLERKNQEQALKKIIQGQHQPHFVQPIMHTPLISSFSMAFKRLLTDTQYGMADRHGRNRIGEGLRLQIDRFDATNFSYAEYLRYAKTSTPVIITGLSSQVTYDGIVPGLPHWTLERVNKLCFDRIFELKKMVLNDTDSWARMKLAKTILAKKYLDTMEFGEITSTSLLNNLYLHDAPLKTACPELLKDVIVPKYFSEDLMQRLPGDLHWKFSNYRDYWPSIFIGGADTSSALHADWANSAAWMGLMSGKKRWRIVHPRDRPLLYEDALKRNVFPTDLFNLNNRKYPTVKYATIYEAILEPGEVIFIPSAAPHQVLNIGETISIAMNFIDIAALDLFKEYAAKNKFGGSLSHYIWLKKVLDAFDKLDLSNEYAMLHAAMAGDDLLVNTMNVPMHKRMFGFKNM